jgi:hypothetical protein
VGFGVSRRTDADTAYADFDFNPSPFGCYAPPLGSRKDDGCAAVRSSPLPPGEGCYCPYDRS